MDVNSSMIASIDTNYSDLDVTFKDTGKTYRYAGAAGHFAPLGVAPSAGKYFHAHIKGKYEGIAL